MEKNKEYKVYLSDIKWRSFDNRDKGILSATIVFNDNISFDEVDNIREFKYGYFRGENLNDFPQTISEPLDNNTNNNVIIYK